MKDKKNQCEDTRFSSTVQGKRVLKNFRQHLKVANRTDETAKNYIRSIEALMNFLDELPGNAVNYFAGMSSCWCMARI